MRGSESRENNTPSTCGSTYRARGRLVRVIRPAVAAAVAVLSLTTSTPVLASTGPPALRVMTFNIHAGRDGDGDLDVRRTAAVIRSSGAEVVGLQEVDVHWSPRSAWRDQARLLAELVDMRVYFAPIYTRPPPRPGAPARRYGLAVLSRYPIVRAENHGIARRSTSEQGSRPRPAPGFPEVIVRVGTAVLHVYATHLDHRPDPSVRRAQVRDMLAIMSRDGRAARQVLLGDLNAVPGSEELGALWETFEDAAAVHPPAPATYPAHDPAKRIDYVAVSGGVDVTGSRVPRTTASDHRPVVADLVLS